MSKLATRLFIIFTLVCVPYAVFALPGVHNPTLGGFKCSTCHNASSSIGAASFNNTCTSCHRVGGVAPSGGTFVPVKNVFSPGDFANPFGTYTGAIPGKSYQTSHKWTGSDVVPQAAALPPTDPYNTTAGSLDTSKGMNKTSLLGSVTCARCHNIHGDSALTSANPPYLRSINDKDQMCRDCHRDRDKTSPMYGSHAINVSYTSAKVKSNPTKYLATPMTNGSNPTAQVKLINGALLCSTCHGVHFSDSNSRTFDNRSSARMNNLSTSTGYLLRVDARGTMAADGTTFTPNICTNCHIGLNHSTVNKKGNVQCDDCHSGHVDYLKPADVALGGENAIPNVNLIRRYVNYSAGVKLTGPNAYRRKVFFTTTSNASTVLLRPDGRGICQTCHIPPNTVPEHATVSVANQCYACHGGTGNISDIVHMNAPPTGCTGCHGSPPQHSTGGNNSGGYAIDGVRNYNTSGVYKNESTAGHPTHAAAKPYNYNCTQCHQGNTHNTGSFQDVFINKAGIIASTAGGATPVSNPGYTGTGSGTCATMYCHSNGVIRAGGTAKYKSVTWATSRKTIVGTANECVACHNGVITGFNNMSTNSHFKHVSNLVASGKGYTCNYCHSGTASSNTVVSNVSSHVNGTADVTLTGTFGSLPVNGTWATGPATCSTSYCHSDGKGVYATPTWTVRSSGACGTCHATSPTIGGATLINSNAHFIHFSSNTNPYGPMLTQANTNGCASCHTYTGDLQATHVNGAVEAPGANCTTACHKNGATWTAVGRLACSSCHDGSLSVIKARTAPLITQTVYNTKGHGQFNAYTCTDCHNDNSRHINGTAGDKRLLAILGSGSDNTECTYCHNNAGIVTNVARQNMMPHVTDKVGPVLGLCNACHTAHGTSNINMIKTTINGKPIVFSNITTGFISKVAVAGYYNGLCQVCHTKTNYFRNTTTSAVPLPTAPLGGHYDDRRCTACHDHKGLYAFEPTGGGGCNGCHGYPPAKPAFVPSGGNYADATKGEDFIGGGGAHTVAGHIKPTAVASEGWANCNTCHPSSAHAKGGMPPKRAFINVTTPDAYRFNPAKPTSYSGDHSTTVGTCSNVSCHFQTTPIWNR